MGCSFKKIPFLQKAFQEPSSGVVLFCNEKPVSWSDDLYVNLYPLSKTKMSVLISDNSSCDLEFSFQMDEGGRFLENSSHCSGFCNKKVFLTLDAEELSFLCGAGKDCSFPLSCGSFERLKGKRVFKKQGRGHVEFLFNISRGQEERHALCELSLNI